MKNIILFGGLLLALCCFSDAISIKRLLRRNLKSRQNNANLAEEFSALPKEVQQKIAEQFNQMSKFLLFFKL